MQVAVVIIIFMAIKACVSLQQLKIVATASLLNLYSAI